MNSRTTDFQALRASIRPIAVTMIAKKIAHLELQQQSESSWFSACKACHKSFGLFGSYEKCSKCELFYCPSCGTKNADKTVMPQFLGHLEDPTIELFLCELCNAKYTEFSFTAYARFLVQERDKSVLLQQYNDYNAVKQEIERLYPHYEYLTTSVFERPAGDVDDAFAEVYRDAKMKQQRLSQLVKEVQQLGQQVMKTGKDLFPDTSFYRLLAAQIASYIQERVTQVQKVHLKMARVELGLLSHAYAQLSRLLLDMQANADVWEKFGAAFKAAASALYNQVWSACTHARENWDSFKAKLQSDITAMAPYKLDFVFMGTSIRKVNGILKTVIASIENRGIQCPQQLHALLGLLSQNYKPSFGE